MYFQYRKYQRKKMHTYFAIDTHYIITINIVISTHKRIIGHNREGGGLTTCLSYPSKHMFLDALRPSGILKY